jgi:ABC-type antimicrobial peptide transport system permease subunit
MLVVFTLVAAALFWTTGIAHAIKQIEYHMYRDSNGDSTIYLGDYYSKGKIEKAMESYKLEKVVLERLARGFVDGDKISDTAMIFEITHENRQRSKQWFYFSSGRLPEHQGEIAIPEMRYRNTINLEDVIYLSVYTPQGHVLNTLPFKVVGIMKMAPMKGLGAFLIKKEEMDVLLNSSDIYNTITVYNNFSEDGFGKADVESSLDRLISNIYDKLHENGIATGEPWCFDIVDFINRNRSFVSIFNGINMLASLLIFPIAGAVIAISIRMLAIRRTVEFATYMALGYRNFKIVRNFVMEVFILALLGYFLGITIGALSGIVIEYIRVYLVFQDYMNGPVMLRHNLLDYLYILSFILLLTAAWSVPVTNRIVSKAPIRILREQAY